MVEGDYRYTLPETLACSKPLAVTTTGPGVVSLLFREYTQSGVGGGPNVLAKKWHAFGKG